MMLLEKPQAKTMAFIESEKEYDALKGKALEENVLWVCFSVKAFCFLETNEKCAFFEDFLEEKDLEEIDERADWLSKNWCNDGGKNAFEFNGISLAGMNYYDSRIFFVKFFKIQKAVENILKKSPPEHAVFFENFSGKTLFENFSGKKTIVAKAPGKNGFFAVEGENPLFSLKRSVLKFFGKIFLALQPKRKPSLKKCILFFGVLSFYGNAVFEKLLEENRRILVANLNLSDREKAVKGIEHSKLEQYFGGKISKILAEKKQELEFQKNRFFESNSFEKNFSFNGTNFLPELRDFAEKQFNEVFPKTIEDILLCEAMLEIENPSIVAVWADTIRTEKCLVSVAKFKKIPAIVLQHGLASIGYLPLTAGKIAVWSESDRLFFEKLGMPDSKIAVTGNPRFDSIAVEKFSGKKEFFEKNSIPLQKKLVVFLTQPLAEFSAKIPQLEIFKISKDIVEIAAESKNAFFVFIVHPSDDERVYEKLSKNCKNVLVVRPGRGDKGFHEWLWNADILLAHSSTSALEAAVFGKPLIAANYSDFSKTLNFPKEIAESASGKKELLEKLDVFISGENAAKSFDERQKNAMKKLYKIDKTSAEKIIKLMDSMLEM